MIINKKRALFSVLTVIVTVGLIEAMLNILTWTSPRVAQLLTSPWPIVPDDHLGYRPSPGIPDHDSRGWRNPMAYKKADLVALGDSQTYGAGVDAMEAWPRQLEAMTSHRVC